jgi:hypothetical protein
MPETLREIAVRPHQRRVLVAGGGSLDETMDFLLALL